MSAFEPTDATSCVQVVVRVRPMNDKEQKGNTLPVVTASTEKKEVTVIRGAGNRQQRTTYNFDDVLTSFSTQQEVFDTTIAPNIHDVLDGFECTMFAYGQTGTGKTHTMEGDLSSENNRGVIPRAAHAIFERLRTEQYVDSSVSASYLEIYNEELADLLVDDGKDVKLQICEDTRPRGKGIFVHNLSETIVTSAEDVLRLMQKAQERRRVGETKMNKQSSRSHCLFTLKVHSRKKVDDSGSIMECTGKLHLVDLAGSECAKTAGSENVQKERERKNINQSLLTLGRVISALREGHVQRIPYRDSKLTRLLQESLGGKCKTVIIATISPSVLAVDETLSTLNYAQAAHGIQNKPVATSYLKIGDAERKRPESASAGHSTGTSVQDWNQMECRLQYMQAELEEAQAALSRKHQQQQIIIDRAESAERERDELQVKVEKQKEEMLFLIHRNRKTTEELEETKFELAKTSEIVKARKATEEKLREEAFSVLSTLKDSITNGSQLHDKLVEHWKEDEERRLASIEFSKQAEERMSSLRRLLLDFCASSRSNSTNFLKQSEAAREAQLKELEELLSSFTEFEEKTKESSGEVERRMQAAVEDTWRRLKAAEEEHKRDSDSLKSSLLSCQQSIEEEANLLRGHVEAAEAALREWSESMVAAMEEGKEKFFEGCAGTRKGVKERMSSTGSVLQEAKQLLGKQEATLEKLQQDLSLHADAEKTLNEQLEALAEKLRGSSESHLQLLGAQRSSLSSLLQAQREGQRDEQAEQLVEETRATAKEEMEKIASMLQKQQNTLQCALEQLRKGSPEEAHRSAIDGTAEILVRCLEEQEEAFERIWLQLEETRTKQEEGNMCEVHAASISSLEKQLAEHAGGLRSQLLHQHEGLEGTAASLRGQEEREKSLLLHLQKGHERLQQIVEQQNSLLEEQQEQLEKQRKKLDEGLEAQRAGQEQLMAAVMASLQEVLHQQVKELSEVGGRDHAELVGSNDVLRGEGEEMKERVGKLAQEAQKIADEARAQVASWGQAAREVEARVVAHAGKNVEMQEGVGEGEEKVKEGALLLREEAQHWSEANKLVGDRLTSAMEENRTLREAMAGRNSSLQERMRSLREETEGWKESNVKVDAQLEQAVAEGAGASSESRSAFTRLEELQVQVQEEVKLWAESDVKCQEALEEAIAQEEKLSSRVGEDAAAAAESLVPVFAGSQTLMAQTSQLKQDVSSQLELRSLVMAQAEQAEEAAETMAKFAEEEVAKMEEAARGRVEGEKKRVQAMMATRPKVMEEVTRRTGRVEEAQAEAVRAALSLLEEEEKALKASLEQEKSAWSLTAQEQAQDMKRMQEELEQTGATVGAFTAESKKQLEERRAGEQAFLECGERGLRAQEEGEEERIEGLSESLNDYCSRVARVEVPVPAPPPNKEFALLQKFAATPPHEEIVAGLQREEEEEKDEHFLQLCDQLAKTAAPEASEEQEQEGQEQEQEAPESTETSEDNEGESRKSAPAPDRTLSSSSLSSSQRSMRLATPKKVNQERTRSSQETPTKTSNMLRSRTSLKELNG